MPNIDESTFTKLNSLIQSLDAATNKKDMLKLGLSISDEVMRILGVPSSDLDSGDDQLDKALPNARFRNQKMEGWFEKHPYLGTARIALWHYNKGTYPIESMFYMLSDSPRKEKIAATTHLFPHWEDNDLTMIPKYKVGIDFFLSPKTRSLFVVISKRSNLRVMELGERLTNTQREILAKCANIAAYDGLDPKTRKPIQYEPQRTIHNTLWNAFELKEVNKKFYVGIADHFQLLCQYLKKHPPVGTKKEIGESCKIFSSRLIGRLLFIWFLKKKGIINSKMEYFSPELLPASDYYEKKLKPLFFNTLNTPVEAREKEWDLKTPYLNGGLFEPHQNDWADKTIGFPEDWFVTLYQHLNQFNFTTDESSTDYEQVAVDPEMLGRVFENLLATIVPETSEISERSEKGAFYTPREIVDFMCKASLKEYLKRKAESEKDFDGIEMLIDMSDSDFMLRKSTGSSDIWGARSKAVNSRMIEALNEMRILDPACGSGAFPIGMLQLLLKTYDRLNAFYDASLKTMRPIKLAERNNLYDTKLFIISNCLYGVDIEPMAVEIARLRAWLSLIIDDKNDVDPLPNLDFHFVCANTLLPLHSSLTTSVFSSFDPDDYIREFKSLIAEYFDTHILQKKQELRQRFKDLYSKYDESESFGDFSVQIPKRIQQLKSWNPFDSSHPAHFFDPMTMFNVSAFDLVIGNPPYINFNDIKEDSHKLYEPLRYKTYKATGDMYCLFIEKGIQLLKPFGVLSFITSNKWLRSAYGEPLRDMLSKQTNPLLLIDFGGLKVFDSATVDTDILILGKEENQQNTLACEIKMDSLDNLSDYIKQNGTKMGFDTSDGWTILLPIELQIKQKIESNGVPLAKWGITINYGIKTGLNEAFIVDGKTKDSLISSDPKSAEIIRPILRGRDIKRYGYEFADLWLIVTHNGVKEEGVPPIDVNQYPAIKRHLDRYFEKLAKREDRGDTPYNLRNCAYMNDFSHPKILWAETMRIRKENKERFPRFSYSSEPLFTDKTCFFATGKDLEVILATLNSMVGRYQLKQTVSMMDNGGYLMQKIYIERIRIPSFNSDQTRELESLVKTIITLPEGEREPFEERIDRIVQEAFGLNETEIEYLKKTLNEPLIR